jgi:hypothetical protein
VRAHAKGLNMAATGMEVGVYTSDFNYSLDIRTVMRASQATRRAAATA